MISAPPWTTLPISECLDGLAHQSQALGTCMRSPTHLRKPKKKLAPTKVQTVPRLELCATALLVRLVRSLLDDRGESGQRHSGWPT
ncbi:hypothetical protein TKK_0014436 [Trichogramma kaykai]